MGALLLHPESPTFGGVEVSVKIYAETRVLSVPEKLVTGIVKEVDVEGIVNDVTIGLEVS